MHSVAIAVFVGLLLAKLAAELVLDGLNARHVRRRAEAPPEAFRDFIDPETYRRSVRYTLSKLRLGVIETALGAAVLAAVILTGFLPWLYGALTEVFGAGIWGQAFVLVAIGWLLGLPQLPLEAWETFRLEERFGFNKMTPKLWATDKFKGWLVGFALSYPLLALVLAFFHGFPATWWLWAFAAFFLFQLVMAVVYPMFIMPLFNTFEPLKEGSLKQRLVALAKRTGFRAKTILVMDGSKRSAHSNAFFSGFGRFRRIVLFDTLLEQMEAPELEAVLAHEIGHYKLGHVPRMIFWSGAIGLGVFALLGGLSQADWFVAAFGFGPEAAGRVAPALLLFFLLSGLASFWLSPLMSLLSRRHEYQADRFAVRATGSAEPLIAALRKLHKENLSNLTPHPLYSAFHYSHPTLMEREGALRETEAAS